MVAHEDALAELALVLEVLDAALGPGVVLGRPGETPQAHDLVLGEVAVELSFSFSEPRSPASASGSAPRSTRARSSMAITSAARTDEPHVRSSVSGEATSRSTSAWTGRPSGVRPRCVWSTDHSTSRPCTHTESRVRARTRRTRAPCSACRAKALGRSGSPQGSVGAERRYNQVPRTPEPIRRACIGHPSGAKLRPARGPVYDPHPCTAPSTS